MDIEHLTSFASRIETELRDNILPFWIELAPDQEKGGFYGYVHNDLSIDASHSKASVLNFRILWTFSAAYRIYREEQYLSVAKRAFEYIKVHFIDREYSGVFWMLDSDGNPIDTKKQIYSVAFAIYGLSEYCRATGDQEALNLAMELFESLEKNARDKQYGGYVEALSRCWAPLEDMSLSPEDMNVIKSMNTHLHVLEAYTNLLRVWDSPTLRDSLKELLEIMTDRIIDSSTWSFKVFFDIDWKSRADTISYGHNIEGSWLICEAAEVLGEKALLGKVETIAVNLARKVLQEGIDPIYGGIYNDLKKGRLDDTKDWWPQAEAIIGFFNAYRITGDGVFLEKAYQVWDFIDRYITDKEFGEWVWGVKRDGSPHERDEKLGPWKCPYHNGRMCFEIAERVRNLLKPAK